MLALSAAVAVGAALVFAYVGLRLGHRQVTTPDARMAFRCFRAWWYAAALTTVLVAVRIALYLGGHLPGWLFAASERVAVLAACAGLAALLCNLSYLHVGHVRWWPRIAAAYAGLAVLLLGYLDWLGPPTAVTDDGWTLIPVSSAPASLWAAAAILLLLLGPPIAAAVGYLALLRHAPDRTARYRIALVAGSLFLWFAGTFAASVLAWEGAGAFATTQVVGIVSALLALAAYDPPGPVRRLGIARVGEEPVARGPRPAHAPGPRPQTMRR